jgi:pimeloyl-ACP methyl ester carboxylesterase
MQAQIDGSRVSWSEAGGQSENVIVLVHGFPFNSAMWGPQLEDPPPHWRMIAPDLRGFGASEASSAPQTMDGYAQDLAALLNHLGIHEAVLCGLSMGGYVVFAFLRRHLRMARGLVLCDTRAEGDSSETRETRKQLALRTRQQGVGAVIDSMLPRLLGRSSYGTAVETRVRQMIESSQPESIVSALRAMATRPDSTALLRHLGMLPTQVIVGADDVLTPVGEARLMARAIPGAFIETIPDAGHVPNLEQPRAFNGVLHRFLDGLLV